MEWKDYKKLFNINTRYCNFSYSRKTTILRKKSTQSGTLFYKHPVPNKESVIIPKKLRTLEELSKEEIEEIKRLRLEDPFFNSQRELAKKYNVTGETIGKIQTTPSTKIDAIRTGTAPQRKSVIGRERWKAAQRLIKQKLEKKVNPLESSQKSEPIPSSTTPKTS